MADGQLEPGDRRRAGDHAARRREVRLQHLRQARPPVDRQRVAPGPRGADVPARVARRRAACGDRRQDPRKPPRKLRARGLPLRPRTARLGAHLAIKEHLMQTHVVQNGHTAAATAPDASGCESVDPSSTAAATTPSPRSASCRCDFADGLVHRRDGPVRLGQEHVPALSPPVSTGPPRAPCTSATSSSTGLGEDALTRLRRERIGFVFQSFNLVPSLTAAQNITLPLRLAGRDAGPGLARGGPRARRARATGWHTARRSCPAASSSASRSPARWSPDPTWSSPTSRPARSTRAPAARCSACCARPSTSCGQTVVMVTHDPVAASYADRVCSSPTAASSTPWTIPPPSASPSA